MKGQTRRGRHRACLGLLVLLSGLVWRGVGAAEAEIAYLAYTDGYWQVWTMQADGEGQRQVSRSPYDKSRLSWFPDGERLLVNGNQGELVTLEVSSGRERVLSMPLEGFSDAVLSPEGKRVAFSLSTSGSLDDNNIWIVNLDGTHAKKATNLQWMQHEPTWAPDGEALYFLSGRGEQTHDIWRLSLKQRKLEQLTAGQLYQFDVAVSPQGALAFSSNRSGNYEIWVQPQGGEARRITDDPALDAHPTWSPDGKRIVFESTRSGVPNIWAMVLASEEPVQLTDQPVGARAPVWYIGRGGE